MDTPPHLTPALAELWRLDQEAGVDPRAPSRVIELEPQTPTPPPRELEREHEPDYRAERMTDQAGG